MKYRMYRALVASLSVAAVMLSVDDTLARPAGAAPAGVAAAPAPGAFVKPPPMFRPPGAPGVRHGHRGGGLGFYPGVGGAYLGGVPYGEAPVQAPQIPDKYHFTYSYDVPWDWTHRYPLTVPTDRPYVPGCNTEVVTVPGRSGDRSVNVTRCY